jgi:hypothetical protein
LEAASVPNISTDALTTSSTAQRSARIENCPSIVGVQHRLDQVPMAAMFPIELACVACARRRRSQMQQIGCITIAPSGLVSKRRHPSARRVIAARTRLHRSLLATVDARERTRKGDHEAGDREATEDPVIHAASWVRSRSA